MKEGGYHVQVAAQSLQPRSFLSRAPKARNPGRLPAGVSVLSPRGCVEGVSGCSVSGRDDANGVAALDRRPVEQRAGERGGRVRPRILAVVPELDDGVEELVTVEVREADHQL